MFAEVLASTLGTLLTEPPSKRERERLWGGVGGGRDHHGGIRTDPRLESATAGETKLIHNTLWGEVDLSARMQDS